jgi:hypothetical protein
MKKLLLKTLLFLTLCVSLFSCEKNNDDNSSLAAGQANLSGNITLGTNNLAFKASGNSTEALRQTSLATTVISITGIMTTGNGAALNIQLTNITRTGTFTDDDQIFIAGTLDSRGPSFDKSFLSDEKVSVTISKINENEIEGTFTCDIVDLATGSLAGKITSGTFKGRF